MTIKIESRMTEPIVASFVLALIPYGLGAIFGIPLYEGIKHCMQNGWTPADSSLVTLLAGGTLLCGYGGTFIIYDGVKDAWKEYNRDKLRNLSKLPDEKLSTKNKLEKTLYQNHGNNSLSKLSELGYEFTDKREYPHAAGPGSLFYFGFGGYRKRKYSLKIPNKRRGILDKILPKSFIKIFYNNSGNLRVSMPFFTDENYVLSKFQELDLYLKGKKTVH